jgi:hypothetical protein
MTCEYLQSTHYIALAINLASFKEEISRRKDLLTALRIRLVSFCLLPMRLKHEDMDPKFRCILMYVMLGLYDQLVLTAACGRGFSPIALLLPSADAPAIAGLGMNGLG